MQPTKCRIRTGKLSGRSGTPPSNKGPVRSRDLGDKSVKTQGFKFMAVLLPHTLPLRPRKGALGVGAKRPF